jgi:acetyl esterase/lipase
MARTWLAILLPLAAAGFGQAPPPAQDPASLQLVLQTPEMKRVEPKRDIVYKTADTGPLRMDVYLPEGAPADPKPPVVVFISGGADTRHWGIYTGYGRLAATQGFAAIMYDKRYQRGATGIQNGWTDTVDLLRYVRTNARELGVDAERACVWGFSAGGALLAGFLHPDAPAVSCIVSYYAMSDLTAMIAADSAKDLRDAAARFSLASALESHPGPVPPLMIARAGRDNALLNAGIDRLVKVALEKNVRLELVNYPDGAHGFDALNDTETSRDIIRRTLGFLAEQLRR